MPKTVHISVFDCNEVRKMFNLDIECCEGCHDHAAKERANLPLLGLDSRGVAMVCCSVASAVIEEISSRGLEEEFKGPEKGIVVH